jgi:tetratricopeptide (TPR) repeat protein
MVFMRKILAALTVILLQCASSTILAEGLEAYDAGGDWYDKGNALLAQGKFEEAIQAYDRAIDLDHMDPDALINKGVALYHLRKYDEAVEAYDKAINIDSEKGDAWYNKGLSLVELGREAEAEEALNKAIEINPQDEGAWISKGLALYNLGEYDRAIEAFDRAIEIDPKDPRALSNKGGALYRQGRYLEAIKCYDEAIRLDPRDANLRNNRDLAIGRLSEAAEGDALTSSDEVSGPTRTGQAGQPAESEILAAQPRTNGNPMQLLYYGVHNNSMSKNLNKAEGSPDFDGFILIDDSIGRWYQLTLDPESLEDLRDNMEGAKNSIGEKQVFYLFTLSTNENVNDAYFDWGSSENSKKLTEFLKMFAGNAADAGLEGICLDTEPYAKMDQWWSGSSGITPQEARANGTQIGDAIWDSFPDCELLIMHGGPWDKGYRDDLYWDVEGNNQGEAKYWDLYPYFLAGLLDALSTHDKGRLHLLLERTYDGSVPGCQYDALVERIYQDLSYVAGDTNAGGNQDAVSVWQSSRCSIALGAWPLGSFSARDPNDAHYSAATFGSQLNNFRSQYTCLGAKPNRPGAPTYAWVYGENDAWLTTDPGILEAYLDVIRDETGWLKSIDDAVADSEPSYIYNNCMPLNGKYWTILTSMFNEGNALCGYIDTEDRSELGNITLWLSFDAPDPGISVCPCPDKDDPISGDENRGEYAKFDLERISDSDLADRLQLDDAGSYESSLSSHSIYRINIVAPNKGKHGSYIISYAERPNFVIGKDGSSGSSSAGVCKIASDIKVFEYLGKDDDKVEQRAIGADGYPDGHFRLELDLQDPTKIESIAIYNKSDPAYRWDSSDKTYFILGLFEDGNGNSLNPDYNHPFEVSPSAVLDLYASNPDLITAGGDFVVEVRLQEGRTVKKLVHISPPQLDSNEIKAFNWLGPKGDEVGIKSIGFDNAIDGKFQLELDISGTEATEIESIAIYNKSDPSYRWDSSDNSYFILGVFEDGNGNSLNPDYNHPFEVLPSAVLDLYASNPDLITSGGDFVVEVRLQDRTVNKLVHILPPQLDSNEIKAFNWLGPNGNEVGDRSIGLDNAIDGLFQLELDISGPDPTEIESIAIYNKSDPGYRWDSSDKTYFILGVFEDGEPLNPDYEHPFEVSPSAVLNLHFSHPDLIKVDGDFVVEVKLVGDRVLQKTIRIKPLTDWFPTAT